MMARPCDIMLGPAHVYSACLWRGIHTTEWQAYCQQSLDMVLKVKRLLLYRLCRLVQQYPCHLALAPPPAAQLQRTSGHAPMEPPLCMGRHLGRSCGTQWQCCIPHQPHPHHPISRSPPFNPGLLCRPACWRRHPGSRPQEDPCRHAGVPLCSGSGCGQWDASRYEAN